jgi:hypothetical protein
LWKRPCAPAAPVQNKPLDPVAIGTLRMD